MKKDLVLLSGVALGVFGLGYLGYRKFRAGIDSGALDPTSANNLAYRGVNAVGTSLTGDEHFSLGGWLYDKLHPNEAARLGLGPVTTVPKKGETYQ